MAERIRAFEALFFGMISSQKEIFGSFRVNFIEDGKDVERIGVDAVIKMEDDIEGMREESGSDETIKAYLKDIDSRERIFGVIRSFYIIVKIISEKLSDSNGFSAVERRFHYMALINFTDFSQIRLVAMGVQFLDYHSVDYLKNNGEFTLVFEELGLGYGLY
jgi:hypothetical protein